MKKYLFLTLLCCQLLTGGNRISYIPGFGPPAPAQPQPPAAPPAPIPHHPASGQLPPAHPGHMQSLSPQSPDIDFDYSDDESAEEIDFDSDDD